MGKRCFKCGEVKALNEFYLHKKMMDGHLNKCKGCTKTDVGKNREKYNGYYDNYDKGRYRNNIHRLLCSKYDSMRRRILGQSAHSQLTGKYLMPENEFLSWCYSPLVFQVFLNFYDKWRKNGYTRRSAPSIDRIDNDKGYSVENLQWLTQSENSRKRQRENPF